MVEGRCDKDYLYYRTPCPWLIIKLLRFCQFYPTCSTTDPKSFDLLFQSIDKIVNNTSVSDSVNKSNADHSILFESISTIITFYSTCPPALRAKSLKLLGKFVSVREPNIRYLGLMSFARLATLHNTPETIKHIQQYIPTVTCSLKDADVSVRRRALDLMFVITDETNVKDVIKSLLTYLPTCDDRLREQMVLKMAVLTEKHSTDKVFYVDTVLKLISLAGDQVPDSVWHRVIVIVTNGQQTDLPKYVAQAMFDIVSSKSAHPKAIAVGSYVLGEFGFLIAEEPGKSGEVQLSVLHGHWSNVDDTTRAIMLTSFAKMRNLYAETSAAIAGVYDRLITSCNVELQQRSSEYKALAALPPDFVEDVLREMPPFDDSKASKLEISIDQEQEDVHDRNVFSKPTAAATENEQTAPPPPTAITTTQQQPNLLVDFDDQPASEAKQTASAGPDSLLDVMSSPSVPAPPALPIAAPPPPPSSSFDAQPAPPLPASLQRAVSVSFARLITQATQAVLFQDAVVKVDLKHEYRGTQGRVMLLLTNVSPEPIEKLKFSLPDAPGLRTSVTEDDRSDSLIEPSKGRKVQIMVEATSSSFEPPNFILSYSSRVGPGGVVSYPLKLPVTCASFTSPLSLDKSTFMSRWNQLPQTESRSIVTCGSEVTQEKMSLVRSVLASLNLSQCPSLDSSTTFSGSGSYRSTSGPQGVLARVESSGNRIRVTIRATKKDTAEEMRKVVSAACGAF